MLSARPAVDLSLINVPFAIRTLNLHQEFVHAINSNFLTKQKETVLNATPSAEIVLDPQPPTASPAQGAFWLKMVFATATEIRFFSKDRA